MTDSELIGKVHSAMYHQCQKHGYAAPVDVLVDIGALPKKKMEDWRFGRIPFLEGVCNVNFRKLSFIMHQMRVYAQKASFCFFKEEEYSWPPPELCRYILAKVARSVRQSATL